jgi:hypothetical protein
MDSEEETRKRLRLLEQLHKLHVMELKREASRLQPISAQLSSSPKRVRGDLMVLLGQVWVNRLLAAACCIILSCQGQNALLAMQLVYSVSKSYANVLKDFSLILALLNHFISSISISQLLLPAAPVHQVEIVLIHVVQAGALVHQVICTK